MRQVVSIGQCRYERTPFLLKNAKNKLFSAQFDEKATIGEQMQNKLIKSQTLRDFSKYVSANIIAMIGLSCYILADTFFISLSLGETGLAALSLSSPSFNLVFSMGMMFAVGGATKFAIHKGAQDDKSANRVFTHTILIVGVISAIFVLIGAFLSGQVAPLLGAKEDTYEYSKTYVQVILCFAPFFMYSNVFQSFIRNDGAPRLAMIASLAGNLFNIVFDYVLVFPCNMGMLGAALATGFSPIVSILILTLHFIRKKNSFKIEKTRIIPRIYGSICTLGLASFITEFSLGIVMMIFNNLFDKLGGTIAVAAYSIVINVNYVINAIFNGVASGTQPMISFSYGENDMKKIRQVLKYALITVSAIAVVLYVALFFGADLITKIFNSKGEETLQNLATFGIRMYFISAFFSGFNLLFYCYFSASNRGFSAQIITLLRGIALVLPLAFLFASLWDMTGLWLAVPGAECVTLCVSLLLFFTSNKLRMSVSAQPYVRE